VGTACVCFLVLLDIKSKGKAGTCIQLSVTQVQTWNISTDFSDTDVSKDTF